MPRCAPHALRKGDGDDVSGNSTVVADAQTDANAAPRRAAWLLGDRRVDCALGRAGARRAAPGAYFRRSLLYPLVALAFFRIPRPPADGRPPYPRLDRAVRRLGTRRAGAFALPRRRDARAHRVHRLASVPLGGNGRARGADVDRDAPRPRRRGLRHPRRAACRVLDPRPCGPRRALAHRRRALADRARRWRSALRWNRSSPRPFSPPAWCSR